jgi:hypothetical protein
VALLAAFQDEECMHLVFPVCARGDLYQLLRRELDAGSQLTEQLVATSVSATQH